MIECLVKIQPTPEELASEFWAMSSDAQVRFFNQLAKAADPVAFVFQLSHITDGDLTVEARARMCEIGEYSGAHA